MSEVDRIVKTCDRSLTVFLGGAGMDGSYNEEFMKVFREAGICNPVYGNFSGMGWTDGGVAGVREVDMAGDAASVIVFNEATISRWHYVFDGSGWWYNDTRREDQWVRLNGSPPHMRMAVGGNYSLSAAGISTPVPRDEDRFNIVGYSWGAVVACLMARYYALNNHEIDYLGLVGAPVNKSLIDFISNMPQIKKVDIVNLTDRGDPLYAGMSDSEILAAIPELLYQFVTGSGHFYYSGTNTSESILRKRQLVSRLMSGGLL